MRLLSATTARCATWLAGSGLLGCFPESPEFADARLPQGVRVLGARAEPASGVPGGALELSLEVFDGAPLLAELRSAAGQEPPAEPAQREPLSVAWLGNCHNPPGDLQSGCYPLLQEVGAHLPDPLPASNAQIPAELADYFGVGPRFRVHVPDDVLVGRRLDTSAAPFGVSFSFFVVCRGELRPAQGPLLPVPLACHDRNTGERLGSEAWVVGFVTTYTYADALNQAPLLLGASLDGSALPEASCESDADCATLAVGELGFACGQPLAPQFSAQLEPAARRCLPVVGACAAPPCQSHELLPELAPESVELDPAAAPPGGAAPQEILWVRYFGYGGFSRTQALINDRATGLNPDYGLRWAPPRIALETALPVWAVVQDNRGGTSVARWDFLVRP
jgi:hypothetical protein